jgi:hypothetical protein
LVPFALPSICNATLTGEGTIHLFSDHSFCSLPRALVSSIKVNIWCRYRLEQRQHEAVAATLIPHRLSFNYKNNILQEKPKDFTITSSARSVFTARYG